jgi:hypothetical protein
VRLGPARTRDRNRPGPRELNGAPRSPFDSAPRAFRSERRGDRSENRRPASSSDPVAQHLTDLGLGELASSAISLTGAMTSLSVVPLAGVGGSAAAKACGLVEPRSEPKSSASLGRRPHKAHRPGDDGCTQRRAGPPKNQRPVPPSLRMSISSCASPKERPISRAR